MSRQPDAGTPGTGSFDRAPVEARTGSQPPSGSRLIPLHIALRQNVEHPSSREPPLLPGRVTHSPRSWGVWDWARGPCGHVAWQGPRVGTIPYVTVAGIRILPTQPSPEFGRQASHACGHRAIAHWTAWTSIQDLSFGAPGILTRASQSLHAPGIAHPKTGTFIYQSSYKTKPKIAKRVSPKSTGFWINPDFWVNPKVLFSGLRSPTERQ